MALFLLYAQFKTNLERNLDGLGNITLQIVNISLNLHLLQCSMSCLCLVYVLYMPRLCLVYFLSVSCLFLSMFVYVLSVSCLCLVCVLSMSCVLHGMRASGLIPVNPRIVMNKYTQLLMYIAE